MPGVAIPILLRMTMEMPWRAAILDSPIFSPSALSSMIPVYITWLVWPMIDKEQQQSVVVIIVYTHRLWAPSFSWEGCWCCSPLPPPWRGPTAQPEEAEFSPGGNHYTTHEAISAKNRRMRMPENCRMCELMGHRCIETECCDQSSSSGCNIGGAQRRDGNFNITRPEGEYFKMGISASPNLKKNIYVPFYSSGVEGTKVILMTCLCNWQVHWSSG